MLRKTTLCLALLASGLMILAGDGDVKTEPAHPEDMEINRAYKREIQELGGHAGNSQGVVEPMLSHIYNRDMRISHTKQIIDGKQANLLKNEPSEAIGAKSSTGHTIEAVRSPQRDLFSATIRLHNNARLGQVDTDAATDILDILLGRTEGRIYDGFPLLNFNRFLSDDVSSKHFSPTTAPGEYKTKVLRYTGEKEPSWKNDGTMVNVWEIDVNHLWYDQQFDSDTFLFKIPYMDEESGLQPQMDDVLRINYTIYSLVEEDFSPTTVMLDAQTGVDGLEGSVRFPYKGQDTVWNRVHPQTVHKMTVQHPAIRFIRGVYIWGWNVHPPRIQFLQPIQEIMNVQTGNIELEPQGMSYAHRNRELSLEGISEHAPEKKLYRVAKAVLAGELTAEQILAWLTDPEQGPDGVFGEWMATMTDHRELPPVVRKTLEAEGKTVDDYDFVTVYMNNEMYGQGSLGHTIRPWSQGEQMKVRLFNLDQHTHYFRNVGFGTPLHNDFSSNPESEDGIFSFEIMNFKPLYGAPKVAEMQWRAGWGFRPHYSVVQQEDVFPRMSDQRGLRPYVAPNLKTGQMDIRWGYQFSKEHRGEDFHFNPPNFIIHNTSDPSFEKLYDFGDSKFWQAYGDTFLDVVYDDWYWVKHYLPNTYKSGLVIGTTTEGWGVAKLCPDSPTGFCEEDFAQYHWRGLKNWPAPNDPSVPKTQLRFPPFLRNPDQVSPNAGDIIPPTWVWKPFLWINPHNGTLYNDPNDHSKGYWADQTYSHGRPLWAGEDKVITIEMPRAAAQLFYQFDDLFHDNAIFSPHPIQ